MIVRMTNELMPKYEELFQAMKNKLMENGVEGSVLEINDIATYFRALDKLIEIDSTGALMETQFYRVPIEEKPIVFNLDTRAINISNSSYGSGIGVRGDAFAELILFQGDRFFDIMDLDSCDIYIQWRLGDKGAINQEPAIFKDATNADMPDPDKRNKVFFCWLPSPEATRNHGNITFNIRFQKKEGDKVVFDLSTQTETLKVHDTLYVEKVDVDSMDDPSAVLYSRRVFGSALNSMTGVTPNILVNLESSIQHLNKDTNTLVLTVGAKSPDNSDIVYEWYKDSILIHDDSNITTEDDGSASALTVVTAGTYNARVGNSNDNGVRFITTPSVYVPAADKIKITEEIMPLRGFAPTGGDAVKYQVKMEIKVNNPDALKGYPAKLHYQWCKADTAEGPFVGIEDAIGAIDMGNAGANPAVLVYEPAVNAEGYYICKVWNALNNTQTDPLSTLSVSCVRAYPQKLAVPVLELNGTVITCKWSDPSLVKVPQEEIEYRWTTSSGTSAQGMGINNNNLNITKYALTVGETYQFTCSVRHTIYKNWPEETSGAWTSTKNLFIQVTKDAATGNLVYTPVEQ